MPRCACLSHCAACAMRTRIATPLLCNGDMDDALALSDASVFVAHRVGITMVG